MVKVLNAIKTIRGKSIVGLIFYSSFTNFSIMVLTMVNSIITTRLLGVEGRGELAIITFLPAFLAGLLSFGLPTSLIYNAKQDKGNIIAYLKVVLTVIVPIGAAAGIVSWLYIPVWLEDYSHIAIRLAKFCTVIALPAILISNIMASLLKLLDKFYISSTMLLLIPLLNFVGQIAFIVSDKYSLVTAALCYVIPIVISLFITAWFITKYLIKKASKVPVNKHLLKRLFGYGYKVYGMDLMSTLYTQADKIIIVALLTPRDFGLYSVVFALSRVFNTVQLAITDVLFPKTTGLSEREVISIVGKSFRISMLIMAVILTPSFIIGRFFLIFFFGPEFDATTVTFFILVIECIIGGGSWILATSFNAIGKPGLVLIRQFVAITVNVVLFMILIPPFGLLGVSISLLAGSCVRLIITLVQIPAVFKIPLKNIVFDTSDVMHVINVLKELLVKKRGRVT